MYILLGSNLVYSVCEESNEVYLCGFWEKNRNCVFSYLIKYIYVNLKTYYSHDLWYQPLVLSIMLYKFIFSIFHKNLESKNKIQVAQSAGAVEYTAEE